MARQGTESRFNILLTFTGFHDPFAPAPVGGTEEEGPILSLLRSRTMDHVVLFSTPNTVEVTRATEQAILSRHAATSVETLHLDLPDPTDYARILAGLKAGFEKVLKSRPQSRYFIATASGTPQMHASWLLLAASGEIPALLLQARPRRFVTGRDASVVELDPAAAPFPTVRSKALAGLSKDPAQPRDVNAVIASLGIVGEHPSLTRALETAAILAESDLPVLILGESGTGKEKVASLIHALSPRHEKPFIAVNCGSLPPALAESTLFGHRKGAFTGAASDLEGRFEAADGGTLFLDEVAELPLEVQSKLLRAVQERTIEPLGARRGRTVDVRLVAATHQDLREAIRRKAFRQDLYYRLQGGEVRLPALRERRSDIARLALHFLDQANQGLRKPRRFAPEALVALQEYSWPGNVRELDHAVRRAALLAREEVIRPAEIVPQGRPDEGDLPLVPEPSEGFSMEEHLKEVRRTLIERALQKADGNKSGAARLLGVSPQAVSQFLREGKG